MALSKDVTRGVLNVPGSEWNLMMMRSHDFQPLKTFLDSVYPDFLDQQVLIAALQSYWDYTDPISFAPHVIATTLHGRHAAQAHPRARGRQRRASAEPGHAPARAHARHSRHQPRGSGVRRRCRRGAARLGVHAVGRASDAGAARRQHSAARWTMARTRRFAACRSLVEQLRAFFKPDGQVDADLHGPRACSNEARARARRALAVLAVAGCGPSDIAYPPMGSISQPAGKGSFRFGVATAATQIEDQDVNTDWYAFTRPAADGGLGNGAAFVGDAVRRLFARARRRQALAVAARRLVSLLDRVGPRRADARQLRRGGAAALRRSHQRARRRRHQAAGHAAPLLEPDLDRRSARSRLHERPVRHQPVRPRPSDGRSRSSSTRWPSSPPRSPRATAIASTSGARSTSRSITCSPPTASRSFRRATATRSTTFRNSSTSCATTSRRTRACTTPSKRPTPSTPTATAWPPRSA